MAERLRQQLLDTARGRVVAILRSGGLTAEDIASSLGLTRSAVRVHVAAMERDGVVRRVGKRPGTTRPSYVFELTPDVEQLLSKAYIPLLMHLVDVFADALSPEQAEDLLRRTGKRIAGEWMAGKRLRRGVRSRLAVVSAMMNEHLGAVTRVEANGAIRLRGVSCPLAALTGKHRGVCLAIESLVSEMIGATVHECCDRADRPRCCFVVGDNSTPASAERRGNLRAIPRHRTPGGAT